MVKEGFQGATGLKSLLMPGELETFVILRISRVFIK